MERRFTSYPVLAKRRYLELMRTFAPFRRHTVDEQRRTLEGLDAAIDGFGGTVRLELRTKQT